MGKRVCLREVSLACVSEHRSNKGGSVWQEVRQVEGTAGGRVPGRAGLCLWCMVVKPNTVVEGINLQKPFCALLRTWDSVIRLWSPPM